MTARTTNRPQRSISVPAAVRSEKPMSKLEPQARCVVLGSHALMSHVASFLDHHTRMKRFLCSKAFHSAALSRLAWSSLELLQEPVEAMASLSKQGIQPCALRVSPWQQFVEAIAGFKHLTVLEFWYAHERDIGVALNGISSSNAAFRDWQSSSLASSFPSLRVSPACATCTYPAVAKMGLLLTPPCLARR